MKLQGLFPSQPFNTHQSTPYFSGNYNISLNFIGHFWLAFLPQLEILNSILECAKPCDHVIKFIICKFRQNLEVSVLISMYTK